MKMKYVRLSRLKLRNAARQERRESVLYIYFYIHLHLKEKILGTENVWIVMDKTADVRKMVHW